MRSDPRKQASFRKGSRGALLFALVSFVTLAGCLDQKNLLGTDKNSSGASSGLDFDGCLSASVLNSSSISIEYEWPKGAKEVLVQRDGVTILTTSSGRGGVRIDDGLLEGRTYTYRCLASFVSSRGVTEIFAGRNEFTETTIAVNAPIFGGISSVTPLGPRSAVIQWPAANGVPTSQFKVFYKLGSVGSAVFLEPEVNVSSGLRSYTFTGLGDELSYTFGVQACTANDLCSPGDGVNDTVTLTLNDAGAALTQGATSITTNGGVVLSAPWTPSMGAVSKRRIYVSTLGGTNFSNYSLHQTETVGDLTQVPTSLAVSGLQENQAYYFIVRDEDPAGNVSINTNVVSVNTGDLTAPIMGNITSLVQVDPKDKTLRATWNKITSQNDNANGASHYLLYLKSAPFGSDPGDACASGVPLLTQISVSGPAVGTESYDIVNLQERTNYRVCVKARDIGGNISFPHTDRTANTYDITAPSFDGLQTLSYNNSLNRLQLVWASSSSADVLHYRIELWTADNPASVFLTTAAHTSHPLGVNISKNAWAGIANNKTIHARVEACDSASPSFGTSNCSSTGISKSVALGPIEAPVGFSGIASVTAADVVSNGSIKVTWNAPTSWTGYRGFKVFQALVDNSLVEVGDCPCSSNNCPDSITSCNLVLPQAGRTLNFYVRGYDSVNNLTEAVSPYSNSIQGKTGDVSAPVFASNLSGVFQGSPAGFKLTWSAATDNQYSTVSEPQPLSYRVYRKLSSTFSPASLSANAPDGALLSSPTHSEYLDVASNLVQGATYFYTVCARDSSLNITCDGNVVSYSVNDVTAPTIADLKSFRIPAASSWNISWVQADNSTSAPNLQSRVTRHPNESDAIAGLNGTELSAWTSSRTSYTDSSAQTPDTSGWYRVTVRDEALNPAFAVAPIANPAPVLTSVTPNQNSAAEYLPVDTAVGHTVTITGQNFVSGITVTIGGENCTGVNVASATSLTCNLPNSTTLTAKDVVVTNFDSQSATLVAGYTSIGWCGVYGSGDPFAGPGGATGGIWGTAPAPHPICTANQLNRVRNNAATLNKHYVLLADIDLASWTANSFAPTPVNTGFVFDGKSKTISNWTYSASTGHLGLFIGNSNSLDRQNIKIENLTLSGFHLSYTHATLPAAAAGLLMSSVGSGSTIRNISVSGTLIPAAGTVGSTGAALSGGVLGVAYGSTTPCEGTGLVFENVTANVTLDQVRGCGSGGLIGMNTVAAYQMNGLSSTGSISGVFRSGSNGSSSLCTDGGADGTMNGGVGGLVGVLACPGLFGDASSGVGINVEAIVAGHPIPVGGGLGRVWGGTVSDLSAAGNIMVVGSYVTGGSSQINIGGAVGHAFSATLNKISATGNASYSTVSFTRNSVGGLIGAMNASSLSASYATGQVVGVSDTGTSGSGVGGLVGHTTGNGGSTIRDSYSRGKVQGNGNVGGLVGSTETNSAAVIERSYSSGIVNFNVLAASKQGFVGRNGETAFPSASFYDATLNSNMGSGVSAGVSGESTGNMMSSSTFTNAGWDFEGESTNGSDNIWCINPASYPHLCWQD